MSADMKGHAMTRQKPGPKSLEWLRANCRQYEEAESIANRVKAEQEANRLQMKGDA